MRVLAEDDRALQSGVVYLDDAVLAKQLLVLLQQQVQDLAVGVRVPTAVAAGGLHLHAGHEEAAGQRVNHVVLHVLAAAAGQNLDGRLALGNVDDGQVARCLHHAGVGGNHAYHAVVAGMDGIDEVVLNFLWHFLGRCGHLFGGERDALRLNELVLVVEYLAEGFYDFL